VRRAVERLAHHGVIARNPRILENLARQRLYFSFMARSRISYRPLIGLSLPTRLLAKNKEQPMLDLGLVVFGVAFFVLSIGYALACDRL